MKKLGIIGGGRAAWAFGSAWRRLGVPMSGVWLRAESGSALPELLGIPRLSLDALAAESELILIAVPDGVIGEIAARIPPAAGIVFHASGALPHVRGGFSLHPLRVLPPAGVECDLRGTLLVFEGSHRAAAQEITTAIGGRFAEVSTAAKPLYHAGAVFGANYVAALLEIAEELVSEAGITNAREDLAALAASAVENWRTNRGEGRFTGPAARGDAEVLRRHIEAIGDRTQVAEIYGLLADRIARAILARRK